MESLWVVNFVFSKSATGNLTASLMKGYASKNWGLNTDSDSISVKKRSFFLINEILFFRYL